MTTRRLCNTIRKEKIKKSKGNCDLYGAKGYREEVLFAERMMKEKEKKPVIKIKKNHIPFRVDARTVIYIHKKTTQEQKDALQEKYRIENYIENTLKTYR